MWRRGFGPLALALIAGALVGVVSSVPPAKPAAAAQPNGFTEQVVFSGLTHPTKLVFAPDGRIFVAEKSGVIKEFDSLSDTTPTVFADISTQVHDWEDHGLLGLAVPPDFPTNPYVYALYTADAPIGGTAPVFRDSCPNNVCVTSGRLSRLQADGNQMTGSEQVLLNDWCEVSETHSIGNVAFGPDGALWVSGGEGASASIADWGQFGSPSNPCGDPPGLVGSAMNPPSAEGGALRSQSSQRIDGPSVLGGTVIRIDPNTAAGLPDNPYASSSDPNKRRIVTYGVRNPFRWTFRPGTNEIWLGDVGWNTWEEINRNPNPLSPTVTNFGWPCYEGTGHQPQYDQAGLIQCQNLYNAGTATGPWYTYNHAAQVVPGEPCGTGGSSPTGVAFYPTSGGNYPGAYDGALFWADYSRNCIWAMMPGANGLPDPSKILTFDSGAAAPVDLEIGPGGDLFYVDLSGGTVRRIRYSSTNHPPVAAATANPVSGHPPLAVSFSAAGSTDPDPGDILSYAWDFTNDGTTDATGVTASFTYPSPGTYTAKLTVTDSSLETNTTTVTISVDNDAPVPVIDTPASTFHYSTGDTISFSGHATDPQDGTEPASRLQWQAVLHHCATPTSCHEHFIQQFDGVASGSFQAPDHSYPSYLELRLTANDATGASTQTSLRIDPNTVDVNFASNPTGMLLTVGTVTSATPFTRTEVVGASESVSALSPQAIGGTTYQFSTWSDGGTQSHVINAANTSGATYTANYTPGGTLPNLTGTVNGAGGRALAGAHVVLTPGGTSTTTDSAGHFTFTDVNAGDYTVTASLATNQCSAPASVPVTMSGPQTVTITLSQKADAFGNTCVDLTGASYIAAGTVVGLTGDDELAQISTPFPVMLYGTSYSSAWLDTNGVISFTNPGHSAISFNSHIPSSGSPKTSVFPLWDDLLIDGSASVRTSTVGTAPNRQFVVEWRNATFYSDQASRVTFEVIFSEPSGAITLTYQGIDTTRAEERGATAVIGIENAAGTDGFEYTFHQPLLTTGLGVTFMPPGSGGAGPPPTGSVTGKVTKQSDGTAVSGATVMLSPAGATATTAADGSYSFTGVAFDTYTVTATIEAGQCDGQSGSGTVTVSGAQTLDIAVKQRSDLFGYTCTTGASAYVAAGTVVGLTGDDNITSVGTPFPVRYYGSSYSTAWIDTNGTISFTNPGGSDVTFGTHIPASGSPNAAVFPFFDDLLIDGSASIRTAATGTAPNRQFIVEWRNARSFGDSNSRVTVEAIFSEANGDITFAYTNLSNTAVAQGSNAVVGIENAAGNDGFEYAFQSPVLSSSVSVTFHNPNAGPPQIGSVAGHVTLPNAGGPAAGAPVTMSPGGFSATTAADGSYQFANVPSGSYTVSAGGGSTQCGGQTASAPVTVDGNKTVDLALTVTSKSDSFGYTCTTGPATYVSAGTVLRLIGDDAITSITLPFAVTLYGTSYTTAWVDTNGVVSFANPGGSAVAWNTHIPGTAKPNAAVYPFWDDLLIDGSASIRTATIGTAPNRQFVIEWRNAAIFSDNSTRVNFEVIFTEGSNAIQFVYGTLSSTDMGQGGTAVIGIENAAGTVAFEYVYHLAILTPNTGVTFRAP